MSFVDAIRYHEGVAGVERETDTRRGTHEQARQPGRHHPHLSEVRSRPVPQPDGAAARPGVAGVRAPAALRQPAPAHRGGVGPRRASRSQPDSRTGSESGIARGPATRTQDGRSSKPTRPAACRARRITTSTVRPTETKPPTKLRRAFDEAVREEQLHDLEQLWYRSGDEHGPFARQLLRLAERARREISDR